MPQHTPNGVDYLIVCAARFMGHHSCAAERNCSLTDDSMVREQSHLTILWSAVDTAPPPLTEQPHGLRRVSFRPNVITAVLMYVDITHTPSAETFGAVPGEPYGRECSG